MSDGAGKGPRNAREDLFQERKAKALACEMGYDQREPMRLYAQSKGLEIEFYKDLASLDRGFWIKEKK